jgi:hypothetical protein
MSDEDRYQVVVRPPGGFKERYANRLRDDLVADGFNADAVSVQPLDGGGGDGLDHADAKVLGALDHGETYTTSRLARLYEQHGGISSRETARTRAERLLKESFFQTDGRRHTYRG